MNWVTTVLILYSIFCIGMGVYGFVAPANPSVISLIAGVAGGVIVLLGLSLAGQRRMLGYGLAALVMVAMIGRFLPVFIRAEDKSQALFPALTMVIASAIGLIVLIAGHFMQPSAEA